MDESNEGTPQLQPTISSPLASYPILRNWSTSFGFCVLGLFLGNIAQSICALIIQIGGVALALLTFPGSDPTFISTLVTAPFYLLLTSLYVIYAAVVYPSYFTEKPLIRTNETIALFNIACGGIIFGALWNTCLTKSRCAGKPDKGVSWITFLVFMGLGILLQITAFEFILIRLPYLL